jgi:hypothetical protein
VQTYAAVTVKPRQGLGCETVEILLTWPAEGSSSRPRPTPAAPTSEGWHGQLKATQSHCKAYHNVQHTLPEGSSSRPSSSHTAASDPSARSVSAPAHGSCGGGVEGCGGVWRGVEGRKPARPWILHGY